MKYYSEKLDKMFETATELAKAEADAEAKEQEKTQKAKEKKSEAGKIEKLYAEKNTAVAEFNKKFLELRDNYNQKIRDARKEFETEVAEISAKKDSAEKAYTDALNAFIKKHPEGYHMTLRDGNNISTISGSGFSGLFNDFNNNFKTADKLMNDLINLLR